jgi:hypothetical protein
MGTWASGIVPKHRKDAPPARSCLRGRWKMRECYRNTIKIHLRLAFTCEGGGGVGNSIERMHEGQCWCAQNAVSLRTSQVSYTMGLL